MNYKKHRNLRKREIQEVFEHPRSQLKIGQDRKKAEDTEACPVQEILLEIDLDSFTKIESAIVLP